jgi:twitching motility protein PilT
MNSIESPDQSLIDQSSLIDSAILDAAALKASILDLAKSDIYFSDLLIEEDSPVRMKGSRGWVPCPESIIPKPSRATIEAFIRSNISPSWEDDMRNTGALNHAMDLAEWRLRLSAYTTRGAESIKIGVRRNPSTPWSIEDAGLPSAIRFMLQVPRGLILIGGPTGAGKTTTMATMVAVISELGAYHIVTIEDPIEYIQKSSRSIFSQREVGVDVQSFDMGVREAMRQTPDVIVIGEIRDAATAETALLAAESGHLVLGTLHSNSAIGSIQKLLSWFPGDERAPRAATLAATLVGVINQIRLPRQDSDHPVVASEILLNNKQQLSKAIISGPDKMVAALSERGQDDRVSVDMGDALLKLIDTGTISPVDAVRAVLGNGQAYDKIQRANEAKGVKS